MEKNGKIYWDERIILFMKGATLSQKLCFNLLENFMREKDISEAVVQRFSVKKLFLKILQN